MSDTTDTREALMWLDAHMAAQPWDHPDNGYWMLARVRMRFQARISAPLPILVFKLPQERMGVN